MSCTECTGTCVSNSPPSDILAASELLSRKANSCTVFAAFVNTFSAADGVTDSAFPDVIAPVRLTSLS